MTDDELPRIVGSAWAIYARQGITGLLVFGGGMFLQWPRGRGNDADADAAGCNTTGGMTA